MWFLLFIFDLSINQKQIAMNKTEKLIAAFKASGLKESEDIELDNLDEAKLTYDDEGEVVVENEHGTQFPVLDLSMSEKNVFLSLIATLPRTKKLFRITYRVEIYIEADTEEDASVEFENRDWAEIQDEATFVECVSIDEETE
jgi:hypothetical protein